jgi:hypothetical protein
MVLNITDISGKTVLQQSISKGASEISISVHALSNGLYFLNSSIPGAKAVSFMKH